MTEKYINERLYNQNNYVYYPPPKQKLISIAVIFLIFLIIFIFKNKPQINSDQLLRQSLINSLSQGFQLNIYKNQSILCRIPYRNSEIQINVPESNLNCSYKPNIQSSVYLDQILSNGIAESPLYTDYFKSLKDGAEIFNPLSSPQPISSLTYYLDLSSQITTLNLEIVYIQNLAGLIYFNIPTGYSLKNLTLDDQIIPPQYLTLQKQRLVLDATALSLKNHNLKIFLDSTAITPKNLKLFFQLPFGQTLDSHLIKINYAPKVKINLDNPPTFAQPGFLQYNLPIKGLYLLKLQYDQTHI